mgnify:CR=1 FL=1
MPASPVDQRERQAEEEGREHADRERYDEQQADGNAEAFPGPGRNRHRSEVFYRMGLLGHRFQLIQRVRFLAGLYTTIIGGRPRSGRGNPPVRHRS